MAKKETFESALAQLQAAVDELESGELGLDASLACFERGFKQARRCRELLSLAETRVELLLGDDRGNLHTEPFAPGREED